MKNIKKTINGISRRGFTLIELLIFSAIFTVISVTFIAILISVTRVHVRESSNAEVNRQSQFLIHTIQRNIEESSLIDIEVDPVTGTKTTSTLVLRMPASSDDPSNFARTYIYASSGIAYIKTKDNGAPEPLSTGRVKVDSLIFTKRSNPPGHDSVDISLSISYNTDNIQKKFAQVIKTSVARVNAATFDSNLIPASTTDLVIGTAAVEWRSINGTINFKEEAEGNYLRVGINQANPTYRLDIFTLPTQSDDGGLRVVGTSTFSNNVIIGPGSVKLLNTTAPSCAVAADVGAIFLTTNSGKSYLKFCTWDTVPPAGFRWLYLTATSSPSY
ncbi:MAG: prepilin-type N-terminal cleavage/methylation domain-containing protein [Patescibacteria group bacterium]